MTIKQDDVMNQSAFTFQTQARPDDVSFPTFPSSLLSIPPVNFQEALWGWQNQLPQQSSSNFLEQSNQSDPFLNPMKDIQNFNFQGSQYEYYYQEDINKYESDQNSSLHQQPAQYTRQDMSDGYKWRKYGQKLVRGTEISRSYYKCTYPNCPIRKKIERSLDGQITGVAYNGRHNHPKPVNSRRSSSSSQTCISKSNDFQDHSSVSRRSLSGQVAMPKNDELDTDSQRSRLLQYQFDDEEPQAKRWQGEAENECTSAASGNVIVVRESRVIIQIISDIDTPDDGYKWRKYGQKVIKGNPNPRNYYKCVNSGCSVRKHVQREAHDVRVVNTTYEGKHNHDVPAVESSTRNNSSLPTSGYNSMVPSMTIPLALNDVQSNQRLGEGVGQLSVFAQNSESDNFGCINHAQHTNMFSN